MKFKEILIIGLILLSTFILALIPVLRGCSEEENIEGSQEAVESTERSYITITLKGEIINEAFAEGDELINEKIIEIPIGESYGYILSFAYTYRTSCSDFSGDLTKRYFEDTVIIIPSTNERLDIDDTTDSSQININEASKAELETLKGIGPSRARKIIEYRKNKKIESFTELKELLGVSDGFIEDIKKQAVL